MKPRLSISIPAYGYPDSLKANVARLLACKRRDIEIVVVDNDETGVQIKEHMLKIKDNRFHYYQNKCNIGRANNIVRAVERAEADFVLLMSCDDELYLDALDQVMDIIDDSPELALIMGTVATSLGGVAYANIGAGRYERGFQVLNALPFLGSLVPIILNKKYIECEKLYDLDETYMQNRLALTVANSGDLMVLDCVLGMQVDYMADRFDGGGEIEVFEKGIDMSSWNTGGCYYGPYCRIEQLQSELDIINQYELRSDKKIKIVDKFVSRRIGHLCNYIVGCHDPYLVKSAGTEGFMTYEKIFNIFLERMGSYFKELEQNKCYFFSGRLQDIVNNELLLLEQAETIMDAIQEKNAVVWERGDKSDKLIGLLGLINIKVKVIADRGKSTGKNTEIIDLDHLSQEDVVLVPDVYSDAIEKKLKHRGESRHYFMDQMGKYLTVVYCSRHTDETSMKPFLNFY
ncbi:MAG: glycosyltransferase family 2 protein [Roseburia sp.]|nr:glycosyltransferase family 2 protein [Roseburia sp.]